MPDFGKIMELVQKFAPLMDEFEKVKIKNYEIEEDAETSSVYLSVYLQDAESLERLKKILAEAMAIMKVQEK